MARSLPALLLGAAALAMAAPALALVPEEARPYELSLGLGAPYALDPVFLNVILVNAQAGMGLDLGLLAVDAQAAAFGAVLRTGLFANVVLRPTEAVDARFGIGPAVDWRCRDAWETCRRSTGFEARARVSRLSKWERRAGVFLEAAYFKGDRRMYRNWPTGYPRLAGGGVLRLP